MANDINTNNPLLGNVHRGSNNSTTQGTERRTSETAASAPSPDRVSVTSEATRLQEIEEQLMAVPEVNSAKVAEIKFAIANGSFEINPQRIAEKLISFEGGGEV